MREFKHPNMTTFTCPVCKSNKDLPVVLVPIDGTENDGCVEAKQVHSICYEHVCSMNGVEVSIEK
jgi:hypothetical protein